MSIENRQPGAESERSEANRWLKVLRYGRIYGPGRTLFKVVGRMRRAVLLGRMLVRPTKRRDIAMIGCGQFAFATIGYFIGMRFGRRFVRCYDLSPVAAAEFGAFYSIDSVSKSAVEAMQSPEVRLVYIASNHATHADYAMAALTAGKSVYIEKPIAVAEEQLKNLLQVVRQSAGEIYAGYNRPYSKAIAALRKHVQHQSGPLTLSCFVSGHQLGPDHWYRVPSEGTRICGNVGHWLDLAVHVLSWGRLPDRWTITLAWSDDRSTDDDLAICLVSERGDLVNIVLTARSEPFEGIGESINFQWGNVIAKIDDFRRMEVWQGARRHTHRFWPKDVGHRRAIMQPFAPERRAWREVELSSMLMLRIAAMVREMQKTAEFSFAAECRRFGVDA